MHLAVLVENQAAVRALLGHPRVDAPSRFLVVDDGVLCIFEQAFERLDAVRNVRIAEHRTRQKLEQTLRVLTAKHAGEASAYGPEVYASVVDGARSDVEA